MLYTSFIAINLVVAISVIVLSFRNSPLRGRKSILALSITSFFCYLSGLQVALFPTPYAEIINTAVLFFGKTIVCIALLTFTLAYTHRSRWLGKYTVLLLAVLPLLTLLLFVPSEFFWLLQERIPILDSLRTSLLERASILYRFSLLLITVWLLGRNKYLRLNVSPFQTWLIFAGPWVTLITQTYAILGFGWEWLDELFIFSINLSSVLFVFYSYKKSWSEAFVVRRGSLVEEMEEGWIVLDAQNAIVDFNEATTRIVNLSREKIYQKPITRILKDIPNLKNMLDENREFETDRIVTLNGEYRYLNIRVSNLQDKKNRLVGHLILWRDITNHRRAEDARQQARDEMFVLLNAIANAAIQATSLKDFLSDALYQIIYPFRSQVLFVCVSDDGSNMDDETRDFVLAANLGLSADVSKELDKTCSSLRLLDWFDENNQYLLLEDPNDPLIPEPIQSLQLISLLVLPLVVQVEGNNKLLGLLFMGRKDGPGYKQDEIVRLSILADQIARLIDSDRRRKLAIAFSERQRLMRDIHDSVSQKLYGLVTLTEAAQAAIEAGTEMDYGQLLSRMGENARQAVKELRLFLFQMQPVDLEKEGLISVLHHRLAAVEGRADIKVRFLADEVISISKRKEVALYYIAQEALNNVLRHARAKSVSVTLKQGYKYLTLEIVDDGCGFDSTNLERGGMGLKNIIERVKQENGKLKISSKPDKGTSIKVNFELDLPDKNE